jgi:hypothetical protein
MRDAPDAVCACLCLPRMICTVAGDHCEMTLHDTSLPYTAEVQVNPTQFLQRPRGRGLHPRRGTCCHVCSMPCPPSGAGPPSATAVHTPVTCCQRDCSMHPHGGCSGSSAPWLEETTRNNQPHHVGETGNKGWSQISQVRGCHPRSQRTHGLAVLTTPSSHALGRPVWRGPGSPTAVPWAPRDPARPCSALAIPAAPTPPPQQERRLHGCGAACDLAHGGQARDLRPQVFAADLVRFI